MGAFDHRFSLFVGWSETPTMNGDRAIFELGSSFASCDLSWFLLFFFFFASQLRFRTAYVLFFLSPYSQSHSQHSRHAVFIFTKCCFSPCTHTPGSLGYLLIGAYLRSKFLTSIHSSSPIRPCDQTGRRWISRIKARLCFGNPVVGGAARCENSAVIQAKPR